MMNWVLVAAVGVALSMGAAIYLMPAEPELPKLEDVYWGGGQPPERMDQSIRPFEIKFKKEMIDDLRHRLNNTRGIQPSLENVGWTYGVNDKSIARVVDYWLKEYDFSKREAHLNRYPQFLTNIQGLDIHFYRVKPELPKDRKLRVLPLLLVHGWPGSVVEFQKILPLLTTPRADRDFVFEVIVPSLPGFGYSSAAAKPGLGALNMAHVLKNLMLRLGHEKFYTQGGDWGATVTAYLATIHPDHVLGMHSNLCMSLRPWSILKLGLYSAFPWMMQGDEKRMSSPLSYQLKLFFSETGYYHIQATKPDTIGIGMTDSPAGLAAYIFEKFSIATSYKNIFADDGNLLEKFTMDELIDNLMMYWAPNKVSSGFRIYAESTNSQTFKRRIDRFAVKVPSACAQFPHEIVFFPEAILRDHFINLVRVTRMKQGGHFAAMEEPELLSEDVWSAVPLMEQRKLQLERDCFDV